ncbi:MAG TPA: hypothetical protein VHG34_03450 [Nitrososphaeraceae archaeon]|nr:hypothetical protein [Nitrososphaeraceae archaeon]
MQHQALRISDNVLSNVTRIYNSSTLLSCNKPLGVLPIALMIIGFIMAIVGNYNMWWGADSMIGVWGAIGILGLLILIAASIKLSSSRHR